MTRRICILISTVYFFISSVSMKEILRQRTQALRIIHGDRLENNEYDFVVLLASIIGQEVHRKCTAAMLSSKWVLTAAHCVEAYKDPAELEVMYILYLNFTESPLDTKYYSKILQIFLHPHYIYSYNNDQIDLNDIALARVKSVQLPYYGQLLATDYTALLGHEVVVIGGGQTQKRGFIEADDTKPLMMARGVLLNCDKRYLEKISYPLVCVAPRCDHKRQTAWYGDAGGPLLHEHKIIGVLVTITGTAVTAYLPISPYLHWIHIVIETHKNRLYYTNMTRY